MSPGSSTDPQSLPVGLHAAGMPPLVAPKALVRLFDSVHDYAIFMLTPQGVIASWNTGAEKIKGYATHEIVGRHFSTFYPAEAVESGWPQEELRRAERDGRFEDEGWRLRKDGSRFWANVLIAAVRDEDGLLLGFAKITRDLTERRLQEEALRESEQGLRTLVEGTKDHAMCLLSLEGQIRTWNSGAARLLGYSEAEALGKEYAAFFAAEDAASGKATATLHKAVTDGFATSEGWRVRADGTAIWCECSLTRLQTSAGEPTGFVALLRNLTERRQVERLQAEGQRMTQFIATLSHELRNPLAPIRHAVEVMRRRSGEPGVQWASEVIERQVTHLTRLVDDLLDFSRAVNGRIQLHVATLDFGDLVRSAASASSSLMKAHKHKLRVSVPDRPVPVCGDFTRLTQVITNLLNNAAKYTPPGGLVTVTLSGSDMATTLHVTDTGAGMNERLLQLAFEPFVQADRTLERSEGGMGIGLALVKSLVELHGGTVTLASPGICLGTTATVVLPVDACSLQRDVVPIVPARADTTQTPKPARRILVVDDNIDAAESLASLLMDEGQHVEVAFDGPQALAVAAEFKPEVVLLDVGLPGMNGLQVAAELRKISGLAAAQLIAVTGYAQPSDVAATKAAGLDGHLTKPFDFNQLLAILGLL